jgi:hypothetical protein
LSGKLKVQTQRHHANFEDMLATTIMSTSWRFPSRFLSSYATLRLNGVGWIDDPSWKSPLEGDSKKAALSALCEFVDSSKRLVVITGAGTSTASGIPDYRGSSGSYRAGHRPMSHQEFMGDESKRQRYWARSYFGWERFSGAQPNRAHRALALLERAGKVHHVLTQNVDGLHQR